ncbi:MAG: ABC transporter permease [Planctomycetota bacterium]|nr:ABC transporter permease [Planctomycetota bacterium]
MLIFALRRLLLAVPLLLFASFLVFAIVTAFPGDPCREKLGPRSNPEALQTCRTNLNLDGSFPERYGNFMGGLVQGDLGEDIHTGEPVGREIWLRFPATVELALFALLLAFILGSWIGTKSALRPGSWIDALGQLVSLGGVSIPVFWLGMLMIALFGVKLGWLPFSGWSGDEIGPGIDYATGFYFTESLVRLEFGAVWNALRHLLLPAVALATIPLATITRMTRSAVLEEVSKDYVTTAHAKGVPQRQVMRKHVRRNALIPVITITGLQLGTLLSGAVLTETVFSWQGMGTYMMASVKARSYPAIMGCMLLFVLIFVLVNLLVDLLYHWIDPRMRGTS